MSIGASELCSDCSDVFVVSHTQRRCGSSVLPTWEIQEQECCHKAVRCNPAAAGITGRRLNRATALHCSECRAVLVLSYVTMVVEVLPFFRAAYLADPRACVLPRSRALQSCCCTAHRTTTS